MIRALTRKVHKALEPVINNNPGTTAVILTYEKPPSWSLKNSGLEDLETTKLVWGYPTRNHYKRALVLKLSKDNDVFSSACNAITALKARKITHADVLFPNKFKQDDLQKWVSTAILKNYTFSAKTSKEDDEDSKKTFVESLNLIYKKALDQRLYDLSLHSALCTIYARDLANTRGSEATTTYIMNKAQELYENNKNTVEIEVIEGEKLAKEGLNLLYNVGKGASTPPYLVILKYEGNKNNEEKINLVGKGLTFDTGGLNLKPTGGIEDMYLDKSGACAVLAAFKWAVETKYPVNLICSLAIAENAIGSRSYKPLDIIKSKKGLTVEIGNTDAEGRLCLADALTYTQIKYQPTTVIDLATLTGACVAALGEETAGVFGNDGNLIKKLHSAGKYYQENIWELPITNEHKNSIKGKTADISNSGKIRYGGASQAAAFLKNFIEKDVKWAHLDIAGPAWIKVQRAQFPPGGTGFGVQLLTRYLIENYKE